MGTEAANHEPNDAGECIPRETAELRAALEAAQADLERVAAHRDALKLAVVEQSNKNHKLKQERDEAKLHYQQLRRLYTEQQSMILRMADRLNECARSRRHAERLAGMVAPSGAARVVRVAGITIGSVS